MRTVPVTMATALDSPSPGGKTEGFVVNTNCDLCDSTTPVKYCPECAFNLCPACAKGHGKIQSTKDHPLADINKAKSGISYETSGEGESGPSVCTKHPKNTLGLYCEKCVVLICTGCSPDHKGHPVKPLDLKAYQNICTQHIKSLLDKTHELEEHKTLITGIFTSYEEAMREVRKWEEELVQLVRDCSKSLAEELDKARKQWDDVVNDAEKGLTKMTEDVESQLSKLHSVRKVSYTDIFSHELAASQQLLANVKYVMENTLPTLTVPTVDDLLPKMSQLQGVKTGIVDLMTPEEVKIISRKYFKATDQSTSPCTNYQRLKLDSLIQQCVMDVADPTTNYGYKIIKSYRDEKNLMIHGNSKKDIRQVNLSNNAEEQYTCGFDLWNMISTNCNRFVAIGLEDMYLLNAKFEVISKHNTDMEPYGVCFISERRIMLLEVNMDNNDQQIARISIVNLEDYGFTVDKETFVNVEDMMKYIATDETKTHLFMCGSKNLYKVKLEDWTTQHIDLSKWLEVAWSLHAVGGHLLVGDGKGNVHMLDMQLKYEKIVLKIPDAVRDIAVISGFLVITSRDNKIYLYK